MCPLVACHHQEPHTNRPLELWHPVCAGPPVRACPPTGQPQGPAGSSTSTAAPSAARWSALPPTRTDSQADLGGPAMLSGNELDETPRESRDAFAAALHTLPSTATCAFVQTHVHIPAFTHICAHPLTRQCAPACAHMHTEPPPPPTCKRTHSLPAWCREASRPGYLWKNQYSLSKHLLRTDPGDRVGTNT